MKRLDLWKLIPPSVDHINEVFHTAVYADGGSVKVEFRVGKRHYVLWARPPLYERKPYSTGHWFARGVSLNYWPLNCQVQRLEKLRQAILTYLANDPDEEARAEAEEYRRGGSFPKSLDGMSWVFLRGVPEYLEKAKYSLKEQRLQNEVRKNAKDSDAS
nr:hypothetical protein [Armatimonas sp.]